MSASTNSLGTACVRQKKVREDTGAEVQADQIVKGYEYAKGQYVILTDDELERIKTERDRTIRILHFARRIHSIRLLRQVLSLRAGWQRQGYELLRRSMLDEGVIGIG